MIVNVSILSVASTSAPLIPKVVRKKFGFQGVIASAWILNNGPFTETCKLNIHRLLFNFSRAKIPKFVYLLQD